ncbi:MAG: hypothetical protein KBS56_02515 [Clostridiales bacterium]|nr:hypothetical protein [Candidatus Crickella equi]
MDQHCKDILKEYHEKRDSFAMMEDIVTHILDLNIGKEGIEYAKISSRVKTEESLAGKLELKGYKYHSLDDITDIFGARVSTLYNDEVDLVAALVERLFEIDWANSVDKRKLLESDRFGYLSIHYICRIPKELYYDEKYPELNEYKFEIQVRTVLQDIWATINHDIGYKSVVEIPTEYKRTISRLAGLLEIADDEFKRFRRDISEYRNQILTLVNDGKFDDIEYNKDSFNNYLDIKPFDRLVESVASSLKAEIIPGNMEPYYEVFRVLKFKTLGDIEKMKNDYSEDAKRLSLHRMAGLELDIITSTAPIFNLVVIYILKQGYGEKSIIWLYNTLFGDKPENIIRARRVVKHAIDTNIIDEKSLNWSGPEEEQE